jgi:hypothetical protein
LAQGLVDVTKRYLIATAAHNLGRLLRTLFGVGKPRVLQGSEEAATDGLSLVLPGLWHVLTGRPELLHCFPHRIAVVQTAPPRSGAGGLTRKPFRCRVGGEEAPPLFKPDRQVSRIRLSRDLSAEGMREWSASQVWTPTLG